VETLAAGAAAGAAAPSKAEEPLSAGEGAPINAVGMLAAGAAAGAAAPSKAEETLSAGSDAPTKARIAPPNKPNVAVVDEEALAGAAVVDAFGGRMVLRMLP
jgi:hypothetical protein